MDTHHVCPRGKIHDPENDRCVSKKSKRGKAIIESGIIESNRNNVLRIGTWTSTSTGLGIPIDHLRDIYAYAVPGTKARNCGDYIMRMKLGHVPDLWTPQEAAWQIEELRNVVDMTLTKFSKLIEKTRFISRSAATDCEGYDWPPPSYFDRNPERWLGARINAAIRSCRATRDVDTLVNLCKMIPSWKKEVAKIFPRLKAADDYMKGLIEQRIPRNNNYLNGIVIYDNHNRGLHNIHRINSSSIDVIRKARASFSDQLKQDELMFPRIGQTITV